VAGFGSNGLWRWTTSGGWECLSGLNNQTLAVGVDGSIAAGFAGYGLWRWAAGGGWAWLSGLA
jgi:hypothetical protein